MGHPLDHSQAPGIAIDIGADVRLEGDPALPGNEVVLAELFGFGEALAACHFNAQVEKLFGALRDGGLSSDDAACVEVDDVGHALSELRVG